MRYAVLIYEKPGAYDPFSDEERRALSAEYLELARDARVVGGARLQGWRRRRPSRSTTSDR